MNETDVDNKLTLN